MSKHWQQWILQDNVNDFISMDIISLVSNSPENKINYQYISILRNASVVNQESGNLSILYFLFLYSSLLSLILVWMCPTLSLTFEEKKGFYIFAATPPPNYNLCFMCCLSNETYIMRISWHVYGNLGDKWLQIFQCLNYPYTRFSLYISYISWIIEKYVLISLFVVSYILWLTFEFNFCLIKWLS